MENIPIDQSVALTGSLSVRGDVLPVGGVTGKIEAAAEAGIKTVLIPKSNMEDVFIEDRYKKKVKIIPVETLSDVLEHALIGKGKKGLLQKMRKITDIVPTGILKQPTTH